MALEAGLPWDAPVPTEHGRQWIKIELDHPVNPWEHDGAGSITWARTSIVWHPSGNRR